MKGRFLVVLLTLILCFIIGCQDKEAEVERIMEDGVEVIINHLEPYTIKGESSSLVITKEFTIDLERNEIADIGLTDIYLFDSDSEQNIYVLSGFYQTGFFLYKFDEKGNFLTAFGRKGQGPGELSMPTSLSINVQNQIEVLDSGNTKHVIFGLDGSLIKESPIDATITEIIPLDNGNYLKKIQIDVLTSNVHEIHYPLFLCNSGLEETKELCRHKWPNPSQLEKIDGLKLTKSPFFYSVGQKYIYMGNVESGYGILIYDLEGNLIRKIRKDYQPVEVFEDYKQQVLARYGKYGGEAFKDKIYFPSHWAPFQSLFHDDEGRLFVMTYERAKNKNEFAYDIFSPEGVFIGRTFLRNYGNYIVNMASALPVKCKNGRLYCLQEKESGYQELAVYKMVWE